MNTANPNTHKTAIVIFNRTLRLDDNPSLWQACRHNTMLPVYSVPESALSSLKDHWQSQALQSLNNQLTALGSGLLLLSETQLQCLTDRDDVVVYNNEPRLLIDADTITQLPKSYTPFRNWALVQLETKMPVCIDTPTQLPPLPTWINDVDKLAMTPSNLAPNTPSLPWITSEQEALTHWKTYTQGAINHYKTTRNALMGKDFSSKLSLLLAQGLLSVRRCWQDLMAQEANEHTQWLGYELLWRDYFHHLWLRSAHSNQNEPLADMNIISRNIHLACRRHHFALAMVHELEKTGYLSNRSRQILASFLIYQAKISWQAGEVFFAHHLLDHDPALNQGNWRYIAGVGADPRGGRVFNLDKQIQQYDANSDYQRYWLT